MTDDILFTRQGAWGVITLNRPRALHALTQEMVTQFRASLHRWAGDSHVRAVLVRSSGGRAFCAGADIRRLHDAACRENHAAIQDFFREEYRLNTDVAEFGKPFVALIDGIVMGGGAGISVHGKFRVAGDSTLFAMPETGIGHFPDAGGGYFLPRLQGGTGLYLGLTGARLNAADCIHTGIATHYTPAARMQDLESTLFAAGLSGDPFSTISEILDAHHTSPPGAELEIQRPVIDRNFIAGRSPGSICRSLLEEDTPFAHETVRILKSMSPLSLCVTVEQMRRGALSGFRSVMEMEYRIACRITGYPDFREGIRSQIIDRDRSPRWNPPVPDEVTRDDVMSFFEDAGNGTLYSTGG